MSVTGEYLKRREQLKNREYTIPEGAVCAYGCERPANYILMSKDRVERYCCSHKYLSCPAMRYVGGKSRALQLEGKTFNYLTALRSIGKSRTGTVRWLCRCSCGKETVVASSDLVKGRIKSCGHVFQHGKCGTLEYTIYHSAKARAKQRNLPFTITISDIFIPAVCPVLGIPLQANAKHMKDSSPTLDRIYPEKGYIPGNAVVVSLRANRIKSDCTPDDLIRMGQRFKELYAA
jgi:hypothetical protein